MGAGGATSRNEVDAESTLFWSSPAHVVSSSHANAAACALLETTFSADPKLDTSSTRSIYSTA